jgi:hypothetical protein
MPRKGVLLHSRAVSSEPILSLVMAGLVPAIHVLAA